MTTIDTRPETADPPEATVTNSALTGVAAVVASINDWLTSTDHKRIGRLFAVVGLLKLCGVAVLGVVFGIERADDAVITFNADALLQLIQGYRVGLIFLVLAPISLGSGLAIAPLQVGARTMAFPRLALAGFYTWAGGVGLTYAALIGNGGLGGGDAAMVDLFFIGQGLAILGLVGAAVALAATVLTTRAPSMTMYRVPFFAWASLVSAIAAIIALPAAFGIIIYQYVDNRIADQLNFGGSEGIAIWLDFLWLTPMALVFAIPALGLIAELIPVTVQARQPHRGLVLAGLALTGVVGLTAATQQSTVTVSLATDQDPLAFVFDLLTVGILVGLPIVGLGGIAAAALLTIKSGLARETEAAGLPKLSAALVFGIFSLLLIAASFVGLVVASIEQTNLLGTAFEEGLVVLAAYGLALGGIGALIFWAPKLWGVVIPAAKALPLALIGVGAGVLAGGSMLVAGALGQAGQMPNNDAAVAQLLDLSNSAAIWQILSLIGHGLAALTAFGFLGLLASSVVSRGDEPIEENPPGGQTLEWSTLSPAPQHNYEYLPTVASATPVFDLAVEGTES